MVVSLDVDDFITETIGRACRLLLKSKRNTKSSAGSGYRARVQHDGQRGRPLFAISKEQLCYLVDQGFRRNWHHARSKWQDCEKEREG